MLKKYLFLLSFLLNPTLAMAINFNDGLNEFNLGHYQQAYEIWRDIANTNTTSLSASLEWQNHKTEKTNAQYAIALLYWLGQGVDQDYVKAGQWLKRAAENNDKEAALKLGVLYLEGLAGEKEAAKAKFWFSKAAQAGQVEAQYNLGVLYLQGLGGEKNLSQAKYWFAQAAQQGNLDANKQLDLLAQTPIATSPLTVSNNAPIIATPKTIENAVAITPKKFSTLTNSFIPQNYHLLKATEMTAIPENKLSGYVIHIASFQQKDNMFALIRQHPSAYWRTVEKSTQGITIYQVFHCCFASKSAAEIAKQKLPQTLRKLNPFIAKMG